MKIAVVGGGGHARVIIDIIEKSSGLELLGIIDSQLPIGHEVLNHKVIGRDAEIPALMEQRQLEGVVIAIGDNWLRKEIVESVKAMVPEIAFPNAIHPSAQVGLGVQMGSGNVVMAGAVINANTKVGDFCILNTRCSVDHDCVLGSYSSFAPGACAGGGVEVGEFTAVCLGANVLHRVKLGSHSVVGAGSTVLSEIPCNCVAFGTPARKVRDRNPGDRYL